MTNKYIMTDGRKAVSLTGNEGWTFFSGGNQTTAEEQYSRVAAAYRAYNIKANTIANMPFVIYKGKEEFDSSATWENKVKFLPNPQEITRLNVLSLIATNSAYNLRTTDALGYKTKGLYHAVAYSFTPWTNPVTSALDYIERRIGSQIERYAPDDTRLVRYWRLDHTTEVLPSANTEARAIMSAAGQVYYADQWISHFYQGGGIPPTLIAMKGLIDQTDKETREKSWSDWLKQVGRYIGRQARIYNAETMDVKQMGSSVTDLKNNDVYKQALENIAMGTGMPMSLLMANSANYATAQTEKSTWLDSEIIPFCNWLAYEENRQIWEPLGLRKEYKPETLDEKQEDETSRAASYATYVNAGMRPSIAAQMLGLELPNGVEFTDLDTKPEPPAPPAPVEVQPVQEPPAPAEPLPSKWIPTVNELEDMRIWREVALRKFKKGESLDFEYQPHHDGLPFDISAAIRTALKRAESDADIKAAFVVDAGNDMDFLKELASVINKWA